MGTIFSHCKESMPPFYVDESLTPLRSKICYSLRVLKKKYPQIQKVRTFKGMPRVFLAPKGPTTRRNQVDDAKLTRIDISTVLDLENFAKTRLKTTLQEESISFKERVWTIV